MSTAGLSIIDEVECALRTGSAEKGLATARRVTDPVPVLRRQL
ncbi:hypothetical protein ACVWZZ_004678 [Bradyrhizobium sp. LM6.10]